MAFWDAYRQAYESGEYEETEERYASEEFAFHKNRRLMPGGSTAPLVQNAVMQLLPQPIAEEVAPEVTNNLTPRDVELMQMMVRSTYREEIMHDLTVIEEGDDVNMYPIFKRLAEQLVLMGVSTPAGYREALTVPSAGENASGFDYIPACLRTMADFPTLKSLEFDPPNLSIRLGTRPTPDHAVFNTYEYAVDLQYRRRDVDTIYVDMAYYKLPIEFFGLVDEIVSDLPLIGTFALRLQTILGLSLEDTINIVVEEDAEAFPQYLIKSSTSLAVSVLYTGPAAGVEILPYPFRIQVARFCKSIFDNYDYTSSMKVQEHVQLDLWLFEQQRMKQQLSADTQRTISQRIARFKEDYVRRKLRKLQEKLAADGNRRMRQAQAAGMGHQQLLELRARIMTENEAAINAFRTELSKIA